MREEAAHKIGEVAELTGLSVRTLRHYDEIGLVQPSGHTAGGFRLYTDADIDRMLLVRRKWAVSRNMDSAAVISELSGCS